MRDEEELEEQIVIDQAEIAQAEKIGLGDLIIAGVLGAVTWALLTIWEFPGLHPAVWNDAAVAAGVRPAAQVLSGYWVALTQLFYAAFGLARGEWVLRFAGHVVLAGIAVLVYAAMREVLTFIMRARPQRSQRRTLVMRLASIVGTFAFVFSDAIWNAGQCLTRTTIVLALTLGAIEFYLLFLRKGTIRYAYHSAGLLGIVAAMSPLGFLWPIILISLYLFVVKVVPALESPLFKPAVMEVGKWHMTFIFIVALVFGVALNSTMFVLHGGLGAIGKTLSYLPLAYVLEYWGLAVDAASASAWLLWTGVFLVPFLVALIRFPAAADEDQFLPYATGMVFFFCGLIAFSQMTFLHALWFWTYFEIGSTYLLALGSMMGAMTIASAITILGVDSLCRNHQRLVKQVFGADDADEDGELVDGTVRVSFLTNVIRRTGIIVVPLFLVLMMLPARVKSSTRQMLEVVRDAIAETVREADGAAFLFTDGNLDARVELEAAKRGKTIRCLSLVGSTDPMNAYLRTRGLTDDSEDRFSFGFDTAMGLRSWIRDRPQRLAKAGVQMGFDLWKRDGKPLPPMGGMMSRPSGFASEEERLNGIAVAHELSERILKIHGQRGGIKGCTEPSVKRAFTDVQWRLARMCKYRSEADDLRGKADTALAEIKLAQRLNDRNESFKEMLKAIDQRNESMLQKMTPREGLQLALVRADFTMGRVYAETIIEVEPENPDANFALGMFYLKERQFTRAETFLKRCLIRRPDEPAVYNNLAMIQIETGRFDAAEANLKKALALVPESAAVLDTKKALEAARAAAADPVKGEARKGK